MLDIHYEKFRNIQPERNSVEYVLYLNFTVRILLIYFSDFTHFSHKGITKTK